MWECEGGVVEIIRSCLRPQPKEGDVMRSERVKVSSPSKEDVVVRWWDF